MKHFQIFAHPLNVFDVMDPYFVEWQTEFSKTNTLGRKKENVPVVLWQTGWQGGHNGRLEDALVRHGGLHRLESILVREDGQDESWRKLVRLESDLGQILESIEK